MMLKKFAWIPLVLVICMTQFGCKGSKTTQVAPPPGPILLEGFKKSEIFFKVQIGAFSNPLSDSDTFFEGVAGQEVMQDHIEDQGLYRYLVGEYNSYEPANAYKQQIKSNGFPEAFVVAYGKKMAADGTITSIKRIDTKMEKIVEMWDMIED